MNYTPGRLIWGSWRELEEAREAREASVSLTRRGFLARDNLWCAGGGSDTFVHFEYSLTTVESQDSP